MAISKTTAAVGVLGTGGGVAGTTLVVKYATSKSETAQEASPSESGMSVASDSAANTQEQSQKTTSETLATIKQKIAKWGQDNGSCTIEVKLTGDNDAQGLNSINDENKKGSLETLYSELGGSGTANSEATKQCENNKPMIATQSSNTSWTFTKK